MYHHCEEDPSLTLASFAWCACSQYIFESWLWMESSKTKNMKIMSYENEYWFVHFCTYYVWPYLAWTKAYSVSPVQGSLCPWDQVWIWTPPGAVRLAPGNLCPHPPPHPPPPPPPPKQLPDMPLPLCPITLEYCRGIMGYESSYMYGNYCLLLSLLSMCTPCGHFLGFNWFVTFRPLHVMFMDFS